MPVECSRNEMKKTIARREYFVFILRMAAGPGFSRENRYPETPSWNSTADAEASEGMVWHYSRPPRRGEQGSGN
jgi:hypothetical protein